jgi:UDP-glucose 4-epimerase
VQLWKCCLPRALQVCLLEACAPLSPDDACCAAGTQHPTRDGTCVRDFIHVSDLIDAHVLGFQHLTNPAETYNIGTGKGISVREFVEACRSVTGEAIKVVEQVEARPGDYAEVCAGVAAASTLTISRCLPSVKSHAHWTDPSVAGSWQDTARCKVL